MAGNNEGSEKFNAALDNLKNILSLKTMTQGFVLQGDFIKAGEALTLWNYDIISWKKKVQDNKVEATLLEYSNNFEQLTDCNKNVPKLLKRLIFKWYSEVMKYSYEIWFSKIEADPWGDLDAA